MPADVCVHEQWRAITGYSPIIRQ